MLLVLFYTLSNVPFLPTVAMVVCDCLSAFFFVAQDSLVLSHWRRVADEGKPYPFTRFNKSVDVPSYTKEEYEVRHR